MVYGGQFGPPEPVANEGKVSLSFGYFHFSGILKPENGNLLVRRHELEQNQIYLQASYGFLEGWEAYLRVGISDLKVNNALPLAGFFPLIHDFKDGFGPFGTFGVKGLLYEWSIFGIGSFFQASMFPSYKDETSYIVDPAACPAPPCPLIPVEERSDNLKVKRPWDVNLGLGLQSRIHGITLYGGPFVYWTGYRAEFQSKLFGSPRFTDQTHYREKNNFGGFVGLKVPLPWVEGLHAEAEGQFRNKSSGGISLNYLF